MAMQPKTASTKQQQQIRTADDALQCFAQHGLDGTPKLLHAVQAGTPADWQPPDRQGGGSSSSRWDWEACPYDLQVVPRNQLAASYCSITATGVVQVLMSAAAKSGTLAYEGARRGRAMLHTPVGLWVRGSSMHRILRALPAFKQLWQGHAMRRWHANVRQLKFQRSRQRLSQQLLLLKLPHLKLLVDCRAKMGSILDTDVEQMAARLQSSEQLLRNELQQYSKDPSAGAAQGLNSIKVYQDLLVGAVSGLKAHLEAPGNALLVDLVTAQGRVALSPSMEELLKGLSKGIIKHLVGVLKAAPRPLRHPSLAALLEDPVRSSSVISTGIAARVQLSSCGGGAGCSLASASAAAAAAHGFAGGSGGLLQAGALAGGGAGLSIVVNGVPVSLPGAVHVPLSKWLAGQDEDGQSAEGGQLLLMMVGDQNLANLRRAMDQQVMRSYREASVVTDALAELAVLLRFMHVWDAAAYKAKQHTVAQLRRDTLLLKELAAQPSKLAKFIAFRLRVQGVQHARERVAGLRPAQAQGLLATASSWGGRLPHTDQRCFVPAHQGQLRDLRHALAGRCAAVSPHAALLALPADALCRCMMQLDDLREALRGFTRALTAAVAFLDSRQAGMVALLDRQAKDLLRRVQRLLHSWRQQLSSTRPCAHASRCAAELLKQLEAAAMAQRLGIPAAAGLDVSPDNLAAWRQQLGSLSEAAGVVHQQESQLGVELTCYADLDEAGRVVKEIEEADAAKNGRGGDDAGADSGRCC
ncbi:hypothetical protein COO60DRAFT_1629458 [Scenedesmus sp. NREL 46B-D3]|nr:hypothetical protein COO60DRAFT_1629458 [Scenedesmus sp. NREL 46B-D3]